MPETYLALLRAINVGGKNKLPMKDLVQMFVDAGCDNVRTYIQSGNVIFDAGSRIAGRLPGLVTAQIAQRYGIKVPLVLRTAGQMKSVVCNNPFLNAGVAVQELHVLFLADLPSPERVAGLDPDRSPLDSFKVLGQEIYLRLPNGAGESKLTNVYFDSKLATTCTQRNWRTVTTLLHLMEGS